MTAKQWASEFIDTFIDQYGDKDIKVDEMNEEQAKEFVTDHIENMVAINGDSYLWGIELMAIKELNLYKTLDFEPEYIDDRLKQYD